MQRYGSDRARLLTLMYAVKTTLKGLEDDPTFSQLSADAQALIYDGLAKVIDQIVDERREEASP